MNAQEIQNIVEARYNRASWLKLLHGVFGAKVKFFAAPTTLTVEKAIASEAVYLGDVTLQDDHKIAVYEVHLSEHVNIERNRAGIRNLLCSQWRGAGFAGAFMLCYRNSESVLRFSYVSESWAFNEEGAYKKESTDALRFTYLLGEGHRSRTAVRQFMELANSGLTLKDVTKAFSVEALSKRFFNEYKGKYEDIVEYVTGKRVVKSGGKWETKTTGTPNKKIMAQFAMFADPEKAVRDYVKKLMGRLVFIQFLQKKGWMGVPVNDAAWKNGDKDFVQNLFKNTKNKDSFIDDVLEPLFDDLNTKRENDLVSSEMVGNGIKVPYLNGGLFEKDAQDNTEFPLPKKYMEELLEFFTQYNFTIDENDPDDAEVGVDPEMLSCIFENLLEDNKEKGAFYTPKEIVQYMCRESLIAYLCNGVKKNETKERIREFVLTHKVDVLNGDENISESVDEKLKNVKICDPAIGSGAFPMGLMRELYFCRSAIEGFDHAKAAEIKKHIIQQNIYGVDIEKGAVDIARLRFWLSLIVDEETPHALPNLDFKIMQGNSLLEQYKSIGLIDITYNATKKEKRSGIWGDLFDSADVHNKKVITVLKDEFFNCEDHDKKKQIREALKKEIQALLQAKACSVKLDEIKDVTATDQFFLWHTWFNEVFELGGFDIVIGNPPYIQLQNNGGALGKQLQNAGFESFASTGDIYCLFYEKGVQLLKNGGHLCFITSNKWMRAGYGEKMRSFFANKTNPKQLIDFAGVKIFENATVDTNILLLERAKNQGKTTACVTKNLTQNGLKNLSDFVQQHNSICDFATSDSWVILSPIEQSIKKKVETVGTPLKDWDINIYRGVLTGCNEAFIIDSQKRDEILANCKTEDERQRTAELIRPILRGRDIKRYGYVDNGLYLINTHNGVRGRIPRIKIEDYPAVKAHLDQYWDRIATRADKGDTPYNLRNCAYLEDFLKPKIIYPNMTKYMPFVFDDKMYLTNQKCFIITGKYVAYLTAFFNSSLFKYCFRDSFPELQGGTRELSKIFFDKIPVYEVSDTQNQQFQDAVEDIQKEYNRQKAQRIDSMLFDLYALTTEERKVIGFVEIV